MVRVIWNPFVGACLMSTEAHCVFYFILLRSGVHAGVEKPTLVDLISRLVTNLPKSGGVVEVRGCALAT